MATVDAAGRPGSAARLRELLVQPRFVVGLALIAAGVVWATARGLAFYGAAPLEVAYGLDQPPILLALVGSWLLYRSRRP